jgi:hypothetical protein
LITIFKYSLPEDTARKRSNQFLGVNPTTTLVRLIHEISQAYPCSAAARLLSGQGQTGIEHEIQD